MGEMVIHSYHISMRRRTKIACRGLPIAPFDQ
jgi:hypothetical protein